MRLFVAVDIPEDVRAAIESLVVKLRRADREAPWVRIEGLHVTLKFIGETPPENAEKIQSALRAVPVPAPFEMRFRGLGFFPDERRPRVLWAGIQAAPTLAALAEAVESVLAPMGIPREGRAFAPHLTLARFGSPRGLQELRAAIESAGALEFGVATVTEFHLYESVLKRGGAEYTRVATFSSAGSASR